MGTGMREFLVGGIPISAATPESATRDILVPAKLHAPLRVHLCNAYTLVLAQRDVRLREELEQADLNLPDGAPVAWLGRRYGTRGPVRGPGLVLDVCRAGVEHDLGHFFYGSTDEVLDEMQLRLEDHAPGLRVVGTLSPPFRALGPEDLDAAGAIINETGAAIVWVGLGTPKQDYIVSGLAARTNAVVIPVGAAFNFIAGSVVEAPLWVRGTGLEWIYRLCREPRRLWRRYLFGNPAFIGLVVRDRIGRLANRR